MVIPPGGAGRPRPARLLLLANDSDLAARIEARLGRDGLDVDLLRASGLEEALSLLDRDRPDLALLDLDGDPGRDAAGLVEGLRKRADDLPLVALTAGNGEEAAAAAVRAGASACVAREEAGGRALARTLRLVLGRERARRERRRTEEKWTTVFEASPVAMVMSDAESSRLLAVNDAFVRMFGRSREEMLGETALELGQWEDPDRRRELIEKVREEGFFEGEEAVFRDARGRRGRMLLACRRLELSEGDRLLWTVRDVTERVERERFLSILLDNLPGTVYRCRNDADWTMEYLSAGVRELTGYPGEELLGEEGPSFAELIHPGDRERVRAAVERGVEGGRPFQMEYRIRTRSGGERWVWEQGQAISGGELLEGYLVDATDRIEARRRVEEAEQKWSTVVDLAPVGIMISEAGTGRFLSVNRAAADMAGYEVDDVVGATAEELDVWVDRERRDEILARLREERVLRNELIRIRDRSGEIHDTRASIRLLDLAGEERLLWIVRDVTELRQAAEWRHLLESSVEAAAHGILITDREGRIVWTNPAFSEITGWKREEAVGRTPRILQSGEQGEPFYGELWSTILAGDTWEGEIVNRRKDGTLYTERMSVEPVRHRSAEITHFVAIKEDVSEIRERDRKLRESEERYRTLVETMAEATLIVGRDGEITFANAEAEELLGLDDSELVGRSYDDPGWRFMTPDGRVLPERRLPSRRVIATGEPVQNVEYAIAAPDGRRLVLSANAAPLTGEDGRPAAVVVTFRDITEQKQLEARLEHQALHDPLTGLANRTLFEDRLRQALARSRRQGVPMGLLMFDIDAFKRINDSLGHTVGDTVLREVARRLESAVRESDTVARWGGDEFVVVLPEVERPSAIEDLQARLREEVLVPIRTGGEELEIGLTAGGVVQAEEEAPRSVQTESPEELVRFADLALHRAKNLFPGGFYLLDPTDELDEIPDLRVEQELRRGIKEDEIEVHYQPIYRLADGSLWGVEALARWRHPERGLLAPAEFVALAERVGLIRELGYVVCRKSCGQLSAWNRDPAVPGDLHVTVNLSAGQLGDPELPGRMHAWIEEGSLTPDRVAVEVTETALMKAPGRIDELHDLGVEVVIDDFGTGYSTYSYVQDLDADGLKIDMSFVRSLPESESAAAIVESVVTLGTRLGMKVVAEGIETRDQLRALRQMGCDLGQGYYFGRPAPAAEVEEKLTRKR